MVQISKILEGWGNYFKGKMSALERERGKVCEECPEAVVGTYEKLMPDFQLKKIQGLKCNQCGCPLSTKLRSKDEECPLKKW